MTSSSLPSLPISQGTRKISFMRTISWFREPCLAYGPDGGVYVSDWTDTGRVPQLRGAADGTTGAHLQGDARYCGTSQPFTSANEIRCRAGRSAEPCERLVRSPGSAAVARTLGGGEAGSRHDRQARSHFNGDHSASENCGTCGRCA